MASPYLRSNAVALLEPGIRKIINTTLDIERRRVQYSNIFNVNNSTQRNEVDRTFSGFGSLLEVDEGTEITFDNPIQGFEKTYTHLKYGLGFSVTEEMVDDDLYNHIKKLPRSLSISAIDAVETIAAGIFNDGFTAQTGAPDSLALFSTAHTLLGGGTEQNTLTTAADLSQTSLQTAIQDIEDTTDDRSLPHGLVAKQLIVPTANRWIAEELLGSDHQPETDLNAINPLKNRGLSLVVWQYLTDTDAWFLKAQTHELNFFWRRQPRLESDTEFKTGNMLWKLTQRFVAGHTDWRGIYGVAGA